MSDNPSPIGRRLQDTAILSVVLAICIFADSELAERFARPVIELTADWTIAVEEWASGHRPTTAVVMISDADADDMADQWPLPISAYARFARRAWCLGASGVFLDIGLSRGPRLADPTPDTAARAAFDAEIKDFVRTVKDLPSRECPAWSPRPQRGVTSSMPVLLSETYDKALRQMGGPQSGLEFVSAFVRDGNMYVDQGPPNAERRTLPTAAFRLVQATQPEDPSAGKRESRYPEAFEVRDTSLTPPLQTTFSRPEQDGRSCLYRKGVVSQLYNFLEYSLLYLLGDRRADWQNCPPVLTVPWSAVFDPTQDNVARDLLTNRMVLLSASVSGVSDLTQTELHKDLPGVYLHALAAESLSPHAVAPAMPAAWYHRMALFMLGSLALLWMPVGLHQAENETLESETVIEVFPNRFIAWLQILPRTTGPARKVRTLNPIWLVILVMGGIYFFLQWKLSLAVRDLLFFGICNTKDIWWLDPTRLFDGVINIMKERLRKE